MAKRKRVSKAQRKLDDQRAAVVTAGQMMLALSEVPVPTDDVRDRMMLLCRDLVFKVSGLIIEDGGFEAMKPSQTSAVNCR